MGPLAWCGERYCRSHLRR